MICDVVQVVPMFGDSTLIIEKCDICIELAK